MRSVESSLGRESAEAGSGVVGCVGVVGIVLWFVKVLDEEEVVCSVRS